MYLCSRSILSSIDIPKLLIIVTVVNIYQGPKHYANGYRAQYNSDEFREFIKNGGVYGNKAPIHNSNGYRRLLNSAKKLKSVYNPKEHEDYTFVIPYKPTEESYIRNGKYRDPEPIYDPKYPKKLYSDHSERFQHNLEDYRFNKHQGKPKLEYHINRVPNKARNKRSVESNEEEIGTNEKRDTIQSTNENENLESKVETYEDADDEGFKWGAITNMGKYSRLGKVRGNKKLQKQRSGQNKKKQTNGGTMRTIAEMKSLFGNPLFHDIILDLSEVLFDNKRFQNGIAKLLLSNVKIPKKMFLKNEEDVEDKIIVEKRVNENNATTNNESDEKVSTEEYDSNEDQENENADETSNNENK